MLAYDSKTIDAMTGPAREMFEQWISFFPTAPLFGVEWRFARGFNTFPTEFAMTAPGFAIFGAAASDDEGPARARRAAKAAPRETAAPAAAAAPVRAGTESVAAPAAAPTAAIPAAAPKAATAADDGGSTDRIRGIGPRLAAELAEMGINTVAQLAALSDAEMRKIDAKLTSIKGRCFRDDWIGQAKALIAAA